MAFLEVLTRCANRPVMLAANYGSLCQQTVDDWDQTYLVDPLPPPRNADDAQYKQGILASHERLADYAVELEGEYVWVLDDDDMVTRETLVDELKQIARKASPDVIMLRMDCGPRGVQPDDGQWGRLPLVEGHVACSSYVVQRSLWQEHADAWRSGRYAADYDFISSVLSEPDVTVVWHDVIASRVQRVSLGRPE